MTSRSFPLVAAVLAIVNYSSAGEITSVPYTITSPGVYYLAHDITSTNPNGEITIAANNVVLDLQGHTLTVSTNDVCINITGGGGPPTTEIFFGVRPGNALNVTVKNGTLINYIGSCLFMGLTRDCIIDHVTMIAAGQNALTDTLGFFNRITNCNISAGNPTNFIVSSLVGYSAAAVTLAYSGDLVENNMITSFWIHGWSLTSGSHPTGNASSNSGNTIRNNTIWSFGYGSVVLDTIDASSGNLFLGPTK
jgi:hypothetical protein